MLSAILYQCYSSSDNSLSQWPSWLPRNTIRGFFAFCVFWHHWKPVSSIPICNCLQAVLTIWSLSLSSLCGWQSPSHLIFLHRLCVPGPTILFTLHQPMSMKSWRTSSFVYKKDGGDFWTTLCKWPKPHNRWQSCHVSLWENIQNCQHREWEMPRKGTSHHSLASIWLITRSKNSLSWKDHPTWDEDQPTNKFFE